VIIYKSAGARNAGTIGGVLCECCRGNEKDEEKVEKSKIFHHKIFSGGMYGISP
jgi:hypothetical protein